MILLLNLLVPAVLLLSLFLTYKMATGKGSRELKIRHIVINWIIVVLFFMVYTKALPSYMPKGVIERTPVPEQEVVTKPIQDLQPKPMSGEERDTRRKEAYKEKLPFIENK